MTPYLMCLEPRHANHEVCTSGLAHPIFQINISPAYWVPLADQYAIFKKWHRANPGRPIAVLWGRLGTEGFNIDERDATGNLIGCTRDQFERGMAGGGFKRTNDMAALTEVAAWMAADGLLPTLNQIDHEPSSTPDWRLPLPERAAYNLLRVEHLYGCLRDARLLDRCTTMVVEFCQFASTPETAFAWDYNGVRVPFNRPISRFQWRTMVYTKILSSAQFYSTNDNRVTINLAAWLANCAPGAMPLLQTANVGMFMEQVRVCEKYKATPIVYLDPRFNDENLGKPLPSEATEEERAEFERRRQGAMDWQVGQLHHALTQTGSS